MSSSRGRKSLLRQSDRGMVVRRCITTVFQGIAGKACAHQDAGTELQASEVEAAMRGLPANMPEELRFCHSAALWPRRAWSEGGLSSPAAQEDVRVTSLHPKDHLSQEGSPGGIHQPQLAGVSGGQHLQTVSDATEAPPPRLSSQSPAPRGRFSAHLALPPHAHPWPLTRRAWAWPTRPASPPISSTSRTAHHAMAMHPQLADGIDHETNPRVKPPYSYATLTCMAMEASDKPQITLSAIDEWITDNFC
ncbi:unnamed protein product [Bubo scandiacus]